MINEALQEAGALLCQLRDRLALVAWSQRHLLRPGRRLAAGQSVYLVAREPARWTWNAFGCRGEAFDDRLRSALASHGVAVQRPDHEENVDDLGKGKHAPLTVLARRDIESL